MAAHPLPPRRRLAQAAGRTRRGRLLAWLLTGPVGHVYAGVADWLTLLVRWGWAKMRGRALS